MLKRISMVFVITVLVIGLAGCGRKHDAVFVLNGKQVDRKNVDAFGLIYVSEHGLVEKDMLDEVYESGETYEEHYKNELEKEIVLSVLLGKEADDHKITLEKDEKKKAKERAQELADKIGKGKLNAYEIDVDDLKKVYELKYHGNSYALSIGEEIEEDVEENAEAETKEKENEDRYVKVYQVTFPTVVYDDQGMITTDNNGELIRVSQEECESMKQQAEDFAERADEGEDIEELVGKEAENVTGSIKVLKYNDLTQEYKDGITGLNADELSGVISGEYGYYVVKVLDPEDDEHANVINEYEEHKKTNKAKEKLYNKLFDMYIGGDEEYRNDEIWDIISIKDYMQ